MQWRVYREEWTVAYTTTARGEAGHQQAADFVETRYPSWPPDKVRLQATSEAADDWPWYVMVLQPVLKAHFNDERRAREYASQVDGVVVVINSEAEDAVLSLAKQP